MIDLFVSIAAHLLKHVRPDAHAASAAFLFADFRQRRTAMSARDALIMIEQVFGHSRDSLGAFGFKSGSFLLRNGAFSFNLGALALRCFFHFLQRFFRRLDAPVVFFARHHLFEKAILGVGGFLIGHLSFVLQSLEGVVGLDLIGLIAIFAALLFPLLDVQLVFLALLESGQMRGLRRFQFGPRRRDARFDFSEFFGNGREPRANFAQTHIHGLQLDKVLDDGLHGR